uniref:Uncharacterized protein n=1 Tax=Oryza sativa subsp. japonica TaxID=39947 RepID=Q8LNH3_ORYSJ|nr:hypothetical protein [Oryza sativa Japonica Group]
MSSPDPTTSSLDLVATGSSGGGGSGRRFNRSLCKNRSGLRNHELDCQLSLAPT